MKIIIFKSSLMTAAALLLSACDSFLDTTPDNRTELNDATKITDVLVSAYPGTNYAAICEFSSDNTEEVEGNYTAYRILQDELYHWKSPTFERQDSPYLLWNDCYKAIASANAALEAIETSNNPKSLNAQKAEALLCRAYAHFILTNVFCRAFSPKTSTTDLGIPYMTHVENTVSPTYERGTVAEDYKQMERDIQEALPLVDDNIYSVPKYHFNKKAAYAFAARFYLYYVQPDKSNYDKVISYATSVLTNNAANMMRDWKSIGDQSANEDVQANAFINAESRANLLIYSTRSLWARYYGPYAVGEKYCHDNHIATTETVKARTFWGTQGSKLYFQVPQYLNFQKVLMGKIAEYFKMDDAVQQTGEPYVMFPAFTTDELLLERAEAYAMKGQYSQSAADINTFCQSFADMEGKTVTTDMVNEVYGPYNAEKGTGMSYCTANSATPKKVLHPDFTVEQGTQENLIQAVLHLRRILTLHEGLRWFDVKRYGLVIYRKVYGTNASTTVTDSLGVDDPRRAIQLPTSVINAGLAANPR